MKKEGWKDVKLGEVTTKLGDGLHGTPKYDDDGEYFFINGNNLVNGNIIFNESTKKVSKEEYLKYKKDLNNRTILVSINGTLGNVAVYNNEKVVLGKSACYFNIHDGMDKQFVKYVLNDKKFQDYIILYSTGSTIKNMPLSAMRSFSFGIPESILTQQKIATILSNYDNLIENNEKRIKILEQIAKLIYEEWFVKFKFPGHEKVKMIDSKTEFDKIPDGWDVKSIMDIDYFSFINEGIKEFSGEKEYFATANIDGLAIIKEGEIVTYENKPSRAQKEPKINSVWFARMKDSYKVLGVTKINKNIAENSILSSGFAGFESEEKIFPFLFLNITSKRFDDLKNLYATGATQVSLNNDGLANIKIIYPKKEIVGNFGMFVKPLIDQLFISQLKNQLLRKTRDFLLPKLISGEVDVSELDIKLSEEVANT